ncbi:hypothetical protein GCM10011617_09070 [Novosphingobium arvoryzae]|uniref:Uncharacterized protein n=1 Tax=Novosphingobium arvoryzae TaxID=1256514 RepID=A0A918RAD1_9SPHN|nr:hypothetical protein GCM10011617_09070 [Novosphingobium arvoryzae]
MAVAAGTVVRAVTAIVLRAVTVKKAAIRITFRRSSSLTTENHAKRLKNGKGVALRPPFRLHIPPSLWNLSPVRARLVPE